MPIKALQFINSFSTGGAEQMAKRLALGFEPALIRSDIWSLWEAPYPPAERAFLEELESAGIGHGCVAKPVGRLDPRTVFRLWGLLQRHGYQILHMHCDSPALYGRLAATAHPRVKTLVTVHLHLPAQAVRLERVLRFVTDRYVACSDETFDDLRLRCSVREPKVVRILNGVSGDRTRHVSASRGAIRAKYGIGPDTPVALVLGRVSMQKAQLDVVEAMTRPGPHLKQLHVWMVGDDRVQPDYARRVKARAAEAGLTKRITHFGVVEDAELDAMLKAADLFLLPSEREGLSVAILEALAAGLPTVISDLPNNRQATRNGEVAWLVPPHDPDALAKVLEGVLANPARRSVVASEAARWVSEAFGFDRVVQEYAEVYETLAKRGADGTKGRETD